MIETTTHCDHCGNPLGVKCDRTAPSAVRAKLRGIWVWSRFVSGGLEYMFFCNRKCGCEFITQGKELYDQEEIHKTQDEKEKGSS